MKTKDRQQVARAAARITAADQRLETRSKHPELIENPDLASRSPFSIPELDRWFLTGDNRVEARNLRKGFLTLSAAASLLGVSNAMLDKLDSEGILPHCGIRSLRFSGKHVRARVWAPFAIIEYKNLA